MTLTAIDSRMILTYLDSADEWLLHPEVARERIKRARDLLLSRVIADVEVEPVAGSAPPSPTGIATQETGDVADPVPGEGGAG